MLSVRLVCDQVEHNHYKYYDLDLAQDLLQNWCVIRRWGRVGVWEQDETRGFATPEEAEAEFRRLETNERKGGYVDATAQKSPCSSSSRSTQAREILGFIPRHHHPICTHCTATASARQQNSRSS
jgi:predicted DNA-binding WGR domain protein